MDTPEGMLLRNMGPMVVRTDNLKRGRLPGFFRLDLRFEKKWRFPSGFWITANAEWFNASLSPEVDGIHYTPQGLVHNEQSPLTLPSIGIELGY